MIHHASATDLPDHATGAALAFADPPYNLGFDYGDSTDDQKSVGDFKSHLRDWITALNQCVRPSGMVALLISEEWADDAGALMTEIVGPRYRRIIWHERFAQYDRFGFTREHRHLFLHYRFGLEPRTFNDKHIRVESERMKSGDKRAAGPRTPGDVWVVRRLQGTATARVDWHPCQLPPEPLERLVQAFTDPGDLVAEQFAGSGSMALAAKRLGREYVGVDLNSEYVNRANERLQEQPA